MTTTACRPIATGAGPGSPPPPTSANSSRPNRTRECSACAARNGSAPRNAQPASRPEARILVRSGAAAHINKVAGKIAKSASCGRVIKASPRSMPSPRDRRAGMSTAVHLSAATTNSATNPNEAAWVIDGSYDHVPDERRCEKQHERRRTRHAGRKLAAQSPVNRDEPDRADGKRRHQRGAHIGQRQPDAGRVGRRAARNSAIGRPRPRPRRTRKAEARQMSARWARRATDEAAAEGRRTPRRHRGRGRTARSAAA